MFQNKQVYRNHLKYFENFKKELEAKATKVANLNYRMKLKQQQDRDNYIDEIHRIRGVLSQADTKLPIGTRDRLSNRIEEIKKIVRPTDRWLCL